MTRTTLAVFLAVLLPSAAAARGDRHDEGRDQAALQDDLRDARSAEALLNDFDRSAGARSFELIKLIGIERRVMEALDRELREASREVEQAHRGERRFKAQYRDRVVGLRDDWRRLQRDHKPPAMNRKHDILVELVRLSRSEIRSDVGELREDRDRPGDHDRREEGRDREQLRDDFRDARRAEGLLQAFDRAVAEHDWPALDDLDRRVLGALRSEVEEASRETGEAAHEARRAEWRRGSYAAADERHDFIEQAKYRERVVGLTGEWERLMGQRHRPALDRKHQMLVDLVQLSRYEIRADVNELHEDRH